MYFFPNLFSTLLYKHGLLICKISFGLLFCKIVKNPLLNYIKDSFEVLNIYNILLLVILFIILTYLGIILFNLLKKIILYLYISNKSLKYANNNNKKASFNSVSLLLLATANTSESSKFHARKACNLHHERVKLETVLSKLDREQPHPEGFSRLQVFGEYIGKLKRDFNYHESWANRHYYRDVVVRAEFGTRYSVPDNISVGSSTSSLADLI